MKTSLRFASILLALSTMLLGAGCSSSSSSSSDGGTSATSGTELKGTIAGAGGESGVLDLVLPSSAGTATKSLRPLDTSTNNVTGSITLVGKNGQSITLTGTYDPATGAFTVSGAGYTLTGTLTNGVATGTYTGPNGAGSFSANAVGSGSVTIYCGTYTGPSDNGTWNVACTSSGPCSGSYYSTTKGSGGTVTGSITNGSATFNGSATGTVSGSNISGTFPGGTFQGSTGGCN